MGGSRRRRRVSSLRYVFFFYFFLFGFLDYTNTFYSVFYLLHYYINNDSNDNDLEQGDGGWGLKTPQLQLASDENARY